MGRRLKRVQCLAIWMENVDRSPLSRWLPGSQMARPDSRSSSLEYKGLRKMSFWVLLSLETFLSFPRLLGWRVWNVFSFSGWTVSEIICTDTKGFPPYEGEVHGFPRAGKCCPQHIQMRAFSRLSYDVPIKLSLSHQHLAVCFVLPHRVGSVNDVLVFPLWGHRLWSPWDCLYTSVKEAVIAWPSPMLWLWVLPIAWTSQSFLLDPCDQYVG